MRSGGREGVVSFGGDGDMGAGADCFGGAGTTGDGVEGLDKTCGGNEGRGVDFLGSGCFLRRKSRNPILRPTLFCLLTANCGLEEHQPHVD